jgi:hypothetical protein
MNWFLVIFAAGFTQWGAYTLDRSVRTLDGPWPDRAPCEEVLAQQQPLHHDGTLACVWGSNEWPLNKDRADLRMN